MENLDSPIRPSCLTDKELASYVYSMLVDPDRGTIPKDVVSEMLTRFYRTLDDLK